MKKIIKFILFVGRLFSQHTDQVKTLKSTNPFRNMALTTFLINKEVLYVLKKDHTVVERTKWRTGPPESHPGSVICYLYSLS